MRLLVEWVGCGDLAVIELQGEIHSDGDNGLEVEKVGALSFNTQV
jgi:hypothetical protein